MESSIFKARKRSNNMLLLPWFRLSIVFTFKSLSPGAGAKLRFWYVVAERN